MPEPAAMAAAPPVAPTPTRIAPTVASAPVATTCLVVTVPVGHPAFAGHFPDRPLLPGVVLLDYAWNAVRQLLPVVRLSAMPAAKFLRPVLPGEQVAFTVTRTPDGAQVTAEVAGAAALSCRFVFAGEVDSLSTAALDAMPGGKR